MLNVKCSGVVGDTDLSLYALGLPRDRLSLLHASPPGHTHHVNNTVIDNVDPTCGLTLILPHLEIANTSHRGRFTRLLPSALHFRPHSH